MVLATGTTYYYRGGTHSLGSGPSLGGPPGVSYISTGVHHVDQSNIKITAYPGETPVLAGGYHWLIFGGPGADNLTVEHLRFTGQRGGVLDNTNQYDPPGARGPTNITTRCLSFLNIGETTQNHAIYPAGDGTGTPTTGWLIEYNRFQGVSGGGVQAFHENSAHKVIVRRNEFIGNQHGVWLSRQSNDDWLIENNSFRENQIAIGVENYANVTPGAPSNIVVRKNVIDVPRGGIGLRVDSPNTSAVTASENSIYSNSGCPVVWDNLHPASPKPCLSSLSSWQATGQGRGDVWENPNSGPNG